MRPVMEPHIFWLRCRFTECLPIYVVLGDNHTDDPGKQFPDSGFFMVLIETDDDSVRRSFDDTVINNTNGKGGMRFQKSLCHCPKAQNQLSLGGGH